jgi:hypothetical protein
MIIGEAVLTLIQWPLQKADEHQFSRHQNRDLYRMVPAASNPVSLSVNLTIRDPQGRRDCVPKTTGLSLKPT